MNIETFARELCAQNNGQLLYLTKFGSHLYGTNGPDSDTDYKGIFLPSEKSCILGTPTKTITRSTGKSDSKNGKEDIDIQLWSLQYFMELVSKGETNALDLLFSHTFRDMVVYEHSGMANIYTCKNVLFNVKDCKAYTGYAIGQAKKYGIKGSRLGVIKQIHEWIQNTKGDIDWSGIRLGSIILDILDACAEPSYCFTKTINKEDALVICGKVHLASISAEAFATRIATEYHKYGDRARKAEQNEGVDWKALSHAVRALFQMCLLIHTGEIRYPLAIAPELKSIKDGEIPYKRVAALIERKLHEVQESLDQLEQPLCIRNPKLIETIILSFY